MGGEEKGQSPGQGGKLEERALPQTEGMRRKQPQKYRGCAASQRLEVTFSHKPKRLKGEVAQSRVKVPRTHDSAERLSPQQEVCALLQFLHFLQPQKFPPAA